MVYIALGSGNDISGVELLSLCWSPSELERTCFVLVSQTRLTASLWEGHRLERPVIAIIHDFRVVPTRESRKPDWCIPLNHTLCSADSGL